jgi:hypothetical protein
MYEILTDSRYQQYTKDVRERSVPSQRRMLVQLRELELLRRRPVQPADETVCGRRGATLLARIGGRLVAR